MRLRLDENRALRDADGRAKLHADIAHPINSACREKLQSAVLASYADELERAKLPGYVSRYDDIDGGEFDLANPYETAAPAMASSGAGDPPLRRGPLRGHTQHARSGMRGPHVAPRREPSHEGVTSSDAHRADSSNGFGSGI